MVDKSVEDFARSGWLKQVIVGLGGRLHLHIVRWLVVGLDGEVDYVVVFAVVFFVQRLDHQLCMRYESGVVSKKR